MKRLTVLDYDGHYTNKWMGYGGLLSDKLGEYENIDEEIGIDYITLNKLRKADKIYVKFSNEIQEYDRFKIDLRECKILYGYIKGKGYCLQEPLSNYNKGFSLSKEELESE